MPSDSDDGNESERESWDQRGTGSGNDRESDSEKLRFLSARDSVDFFQLRQCLRPV